MTNAAPTAPRTDGRRTGHVDPGRRTVVTAGGTRRRLADIAVEDPQRLAEPVQQGEDERDRTM